MNPTDHVKALTGLAAELGQLVAAENALLRDRRAEALAENHARKDRLTSAYEARLAELKRRPNMLDGIGPELLGRLRSATQYFQTHLEEHRRLVQNAKSLTERMLEVIARETQGPAEAVPAYDRRADISSSRKHRAPSMPLALNQVV